jgi:hypothetical protein
MKILLLLINLGFSTFVNHKGVFKFNEETHNFGKVKKSKNVTYNFIYTNVGKSPIIIYDVSPVCGCTIADYTKKPVKEGEKGFVKITFHAGTNAGFNKSIVIKSNSETPNKYLTIIGEVI